MLGSHQYDSIRTAYTVYGSCGSVLQYGETFDIGGVDAVQVTFEPVDKYKCTRACSKRTNTTNPEFRHVRARFTAGLYGDNTGYTTTEHIS